MSLSDRRDELLNMLSPSAPTGVRTIAEKLFISEPTVRRDLKELAAEGLVIRTHGGVMLSSPAADKSLPLCSREFLMSEQKDSICRQAAEIVKNGDVVMLDNSTTALHMVPYLKNKKDIIVITNGIRLAEALCPENIKCLMTGGQVKTEAYDRRRRGKISVRLQCGRLLLLLPRDKSRRAPYGYLGRRGRNQSGHDGQIEKKRSSGGLKQIRLNVLAQSLSYRRA